MKRHESLIPFSRFHRSCLFLALIAKENAPAVKGYPTEIDDKISYAIDFFQRKLTPHFKEEQRLWEFVQEKSHTLKTIVNELRTERSKLIGLFDSLEIHRDIPSFFEIGALLEMHVRKEERVLFQQIQSDLSEKELLQIQSI